MAIKKRQKYSNTLQLWQSATQTGKEKHFSQVGSSLLTSKPFVNLSTGARLMYFYCLDRTSTSNYFTMPQAAMIKYGVDKKMGPKYLNELIEAGFIKKISSGKSIRQPNEYCFTFEWKDTENKEKEI